MGGVTGGEAEGGVGGFRYSVDMGEAERGEAREGGGSSLSFSWKFKRSFMKISVFAVRVPVCV